MNIVHIFAYIGAVLLVLNLSGIGFLLWWSWQAKRDDARLDAQWEKVAKEQAKAEKRPFAG